MLPGTGFPLSRLLRYSSLPCIYIYMLQELGGPVMPPGTGFPLSRLLRLAGLKTRVYFATL
jgi:hypothetical protein